MNPRERFLKVLNFEKPGDRLPLIEWAPWWDQTIERWKKEGLPKRKFAFPHQPFGAKPEVPLIGGRTDG